jgi:hypothetical protein
MTDDETVTLGVTLFGGECCDEDYLGLYLYTAGLRC